MSLLLLLGGTAESRDEVTVVFSGDEKTVTIGIGDDTYVIPRYARVAWEYSPVGTTYWVATAGEGGNNSNPGTEGSPFLTIQHAIDQMGPGDLTYVKAGIYEENLEFAVDGSSGSPIILSCAPGELGNVTVRSPLAWAIANPAEATITVFNQYIWINGLNIDGPKFRPGVATDEDPGPPGESPGFGANGISYVTAANAQGNRITNCVSYYHLHCGFKDRSGNCVGLEVSGCVALECGGTGGQGRFDHGLYVPGDGSIVFNNIFFRNTGWGIHSYPDPESQSITRNICFANGTVDGGGLLLAGANNLVEYNTFSDDDYGLNLFRSGCNNNTIRFNVMRFSVNFDAMVDSASGTSNPFDNVGDYNCYDSFIVDEWPVGVNDTDDDPLFLDMATGDFRMAVESTVLFAGAFGMPQRGFWSLPNRWASGGALVQPRGFFSLQSRWASGGGLTSDTVMPANHGTFTLTGQSVSLLPGRVVTADRGLFAIAGQSVELVFHPIVVAGQGTYTLSGQAVSLEYGSAVAAGQGTFTLTGQSVALNKGRSMTGEQGSFTLAGQDVSLVTGRKVVADQGTFTLAGQSVTLRYGHVIGAGQGTFTLSGQSVLTAVGRKVVADQGTFTLTGQSVTVFPGFKVAAGQGTLTLTGQSVNLRTTRIGVAAQGTFTLSGQNVNLIYEQPGSYVIAADEGSFTLAGQNVNLRATRTFTAGQGTFALAGQSVALAHGYVVGAGQGTFTLTGRDVSVKRTARQTADHGAFALSGQIVALTHKHIVAAGQGTYTLTGRDVEFRHGYKTIADRGSYVIAGQDVGFRATRVMPADRGSYALTGVDVSLFHLTSTSRPVVFHLTDRGKNIFKLADRG